MKKTVKAITAFALMLTFMVVEISVLASTTRDSGLEVSGDKQTVKISQTQNSESIEVTFTFKTTHSDFDGFISGTYAISYDPARMDYVSGSIAQFAGTGGLTVSNEDYTKIDINKQRAGEGTLLMAIAAMVPGQEYELTLEFANLYKDGNREPLEVSIINRDEDRLTVWDNKTTQPFKSYRPKTPILTPAEISLEPLVVTLEGVAHILKGESTKYTATVTNALNNTEVTYTITGANNKETTIDVSGNLKVAIDESADVITVLATSVEDSTKSATMIVQLVEEIYTMITVELPHKVFEMKSGTTEAELDVEAQKNDIADVRIEAIDGTIYDLKVPTIEYVSDRDVLDNNGIVVDGIFKLNYTLDLPHIKINEHGEIIESEGLTNIVGNAEASAEVRVGSDLEQPQPEKDNASDDRETNSDAKAPIQNQIKTSDTTHVGTYIIAAMSSMSVLIWCFKKRRKKKEIV